MTPLRLPIALLALSTLLTACGGRISAEPPPDTPTPNAPPAPPAPPGPTTLTASTATLALAASGRARHFTITNHGDQATLPLALSGTEALPPGSTARWDCDTLAPGAACTLTLTPGTTATAAPMDTAPRPVVLSVAGPNTNTLALAVQVLDFGSVYQGGYVFDIDDTAPDTGSVGGKVLGMIRHDQEPWGEYPGPGAPPRPDWWNVVEGARSMTDGEANTRAIVAHMAQQTPPLQTGAYQAGACSVSQEGGQTGWYLPAICELAYQESPWFDLCGNRSQPQVPNNVKSRLIDPGLLSDPVSGMLGFISSTEDESSIDPTRPNVSNSVWYFQEITDISGNSLGSISPNSKDYPEYYRCVRKLSP